MEIKCFRIKNYKSIVDSGDCFLSEGITILAGKNESGKTSILEALSDFDVLVPIRDSAIPIGKPESIPEIEINFLLRQEEFDSINESLGTKLGSKDDVELRIRKTFPNRYSVDRSRLIEIGILDEHAFKLRTNDLQATYNALKNLRLLHPELGGNLAELHPVRFEEFAATYPSFKKIATANVSRIPDATIQPQVVTCLEQLSLDLKGVTELVSIEERFIAFLKETWVPNFILFSSFEDVFPNKVPFNELDANVWVKDLSLISDLDPATIKSKVERDKKKHKTDVNLRLNKDYEEFWTQDSSGLSVDWDNENLFFWIQEDGYPYEPSLRSKGRQWHLAFYIKVTARASENYPNVILIDEPGLFLHAKAQSDILKKLEASSKNTQILFSTHSPYLLEANKLSRIRLVIRDVTSGTTIVDKIHALADKETLTPILSAIGLELSDGISHLEKANNVVVEGPSDVYYLNAFKLIIQSDKYHFVFGGGAGNMPIVGTILHGWGLNVVYLYDNDTGKRDGERNLRRKWRTPKDKILAVLDSPGSIEDLFSKKDFLEFVLRDKSIKSLDRNSDMLKSLRADKVLLAKQFLELVQAGDAVKLDPSTLENIGKLFDRVDKSFSL